MNRTVTTKGQVTIPKAIRDRLGIKPGTHVVFGLDGVGKVTLAYPDEPAPPPSRFARFRGTATSGMTTEEIMALTRGEDT